MQPFDVLTAVAAVLDRPNVDTDLLVPKQFLTSIERSGFGRHLFHDLRYLEDGRENPDFFLNQAPFRRARILLSGENFGCGSSREHAAWALEDFGFRVVAAPSFGDIFRNNAFNIGLLLVELPPERLRRLMDLTLAEPGRELTVDLRSQTISRPNGLTEAEFSIDPDRRERLLNGLDAIGLTLKREAAVEAYEQAHGQSWRAVLPGRS
ncbi:MAG: 3-isopropylmalate dehydratase small subunit [Deltaproteobacteria bacterium]|jgi:3-isopropylmalate/(R)-2-methylmalate dehydratase small subunit|nr:3-isopropylmalate dehydratase small subunit [Deltaproteobacteria bacterium]